MNSQGTHGSFKVEFQLLVVRLNLFVKVLSNIMDEEQVLRFLTKNQTGVLSSLNDLEKCGKIFLYNCMHLLLKQDPSKIKNRNTYQTFLFLIKSYGDLKFVRHKQILSSRANLSVTSNLSWSPVI